MQSEVFHLSKSSDGTREWYSARDAATGVSIPCECKDRAISLVTSLNSAFKHHLTAALVDVPAVEPVAKQWCAYEDGQQHTSWYPDGYGDRAGWGALAKRNPAKYQVVTRDLFTSPPLSREGEDSAEAFARIVAARKAHVEATETYNTRLSLVNSERAKGNWSMRVDDEARAMWDAQSAFIKAAQDETDAALTATRSGSATAASGTSVIRQRGESDG